MAGLAKLLRAAIAGARRRTVRRVPLRSGAGLLPGTRPEGRQHIVADRFGRDPLEARSIGQCRAAESGDRRDAVAADQQRRVKPDEAVDQFEAQQRGGQARRRPRREAGSCRARRAPSAPPRDRCGPRDRDRGRSGLRRCRQLHCAGWRRRSAGSGARSAPRALRRRHARSAGCADARSRTTRTGER